MTRIRPTLLLPVLLAVAVSAAAGAERYPDRSPWIIGLEIGLARYGMDDINAFVDIINASPDVDDMNRIENGPEFSVSVGRQLTPAFAAGLKFTRLDASTSLPSLIGAAEINAGANVWGAYAQYVPPTGAGMAYGLGLDVGFASTTGEVNIGIPGTFEATDVFSGTSPAGAAYAILAFEGPRLVSFQANAGYRLAKITDLAIGGVTSSDDQDNSGFFLRACFLIHP